MKRNGTSDRGIPGIRQEGESWRGAGGGGIVGD